MPPTTKICDIPPTNATGRLFYMEGLFANGKSRL